MVNTAPNLSQPVAFRTIAIRFTNPTVVSAELACPRELTTEVTTMTLRLQGVTGTATEHPALFRHSAWVPLGRTESALRAAVIPSPAGDLAAIDWAKLKHQ